MGYGFGDQTLQNFDSFHTELLQFPCFSSGCTKKRYFKHGAIFSPCSAEFINFVPLESLKPEWFLLGALLLVWPRPESEAKEAVITKNAPMTLDSLSNFKKCLTRTNSSQKSKAKNPVFCIQRGVKDNIAILVKRISCRAPTGRFR